MIKHELRPAHRPGQTLLCLPPRLAPVPGKLVRKLNSKLVQNPLVQCFSLYQSKKRQQSAQLSVPSKQGEANSGPYCCSLNNLWTGVSFTCLLLIGVLRIWDHTSCFLQLPICPSFQIAHLLNSCKLWQCHNIQSILRRGWKRSANPSSLRLLWTWLRSTSIWALDLAAMLCKEDRVQTLSKCKSRIYTYISNIIKPYQYPVLSTNILLWV